jgi:hypothetical protein
MLDYYHVDLDQISIAEDSLFRICNNTNMSKLVRGESKFTSKSKRKEAPTTESKEGKDTNRFFTKKFHTPEERKKQREKISKRLVYLESQETDLTNDKPLIKLLEELFTGKVLEKACFVFGAKKEGRKEQTVKSLLAAGWPIPSDEDLEEMDAVNEPNEEKKKKESKKKSKSDTDSIEVPGASLKKNSKSDTDSIEVPVASLKEQSDEDNVEDNLIGLQHQIPEITIPKAFDSSSLADVLKQYLLATTIAFQTQASATKELLEIRQGSKEDLDNPNAFSKSVVRCCCNGQYVDIVAVWDKDIATRRAEKLGGMRTPVKIAKELDWSDWVLAMTRLAPCIEKMDNQIWVTRSLD